MERKQNRDLTGDPWNGRTLEWSIPSPPPIYNFAIIPTVNHRDPLWAIKMGVAPHPERDYEDIELPKNTGMGLYIGIASLILGFAMTWHLYWLAILSLFAVVVCVIIRLSSEDEFEHISAAEVKAIEEEHIRRQKA
jgi:cytochrome o ubiquinol oxidase subunit 1